MQLINELVFFLITQVDNELETNGANVYSSVAKRNLECEL